MTGMDLMARLIRTDFHKHGLRKLVTGTTGMRTTHMPIQGFVGVRKVQKENKIFEYTIGLVHEFDVIDSILIHSSELPKAYSIIENDELNSTAYTRAELETMCPSPRSLGARGSMYKMPGISLPMANLCYSEIKLIIETPDPEMTVYMGGWCLSVEDRNKDRTMCTSFFDGKQSWHDYAYKYELQPGEFAVLSRQDISETDTDTNADTNAGTSADTNAGTSADTNAGTSADTNAGTSADTNAGTNADAFTTTMQCEGSFGSVDGKDAAQ